MKDKTIEKTALKIAQTYFPDNKNDIEYWKRYNNNIEERFSYLTKFGEFSLPVQERHIPLQRRYINYLVSKKTRRPFKYNVYIDSEEVKKEKFDDNIRAFIDFAIANSKSKVFTAQLKIDELEKQLGQLQQMAQSNEVSPEQAGQIAMYAKQLQFIKDMLEEDKIFDENILDDFNEKKLLTPTEILELSTTKFLRNLEKTTKFDIMRVMQFKHKCVTGKQAFLVAKFNNSGDPVIRSINPSFVVYDDSGSENKIQKKDWAYYLERMSYGQVAEYFGEAIVKKYGSKKLKDLKDMYNPTTGGNTHDMWALPDGGVVFGSETVGNNTYDSSKNIDVKWVWFRGSVPIYRKTTVDKKGRVHKHILKGSKLINIDDYYFRKGYYINKSNSEIKYHKNDVNTYSKEKGDKIDKKELKKLYHAIVINDEIIVNVQEWENIVRYSDNYNRFNIPIFGPAFDNVFEVPYSLIKETNDIQDLIDIIQVAREYMIAVAGTKSNIIDVSQKPNYMSDEEWEMNMKLGRYYIQTIDPATGMPKRSSFNQWQSFDNSLSQGVQYYGEILLELQELMGMILGVSRQSLGQIVASDQVRTSESSIEQTALITELLFYESANIEKEVLEEYLNLKLQSMEGKDIVFSESNIKSTDEYILKTSKLKRNRLAVNLYGYGEDDYKIREIKQIAVQLKQQLNISMGNLIKIWNAETLKDMEAKVEYFEKVAQKTNAQSQQANEAHQIQLQKDMEQYKAQLEVFVKQEENKLKQTELAMDKMKLDLEVTKETFNERAKMAELQIKKEKNEIDLYKIKGDAATEEAMLLFDDKHRTIDEQLKLLEIQLNAQMGQMQHHAEMTKIKQTKTSNTHINDN